MKAQGLYDPRYEHDSCGVGFVVDIKGRATDDIVRQGLEVLKRLAHRGAVGADPKTGDGAGILIQIPHDFYAEVSGLKLPKLGAYGTGLAFLPADKKTRAACQEIFIKIVEQEGQSFIGWREVPVDSSEIGVTARETCPFIAQPFIAKGKGVNTRLELEKKLYAIRRQIERDNPDRKDFISRTFPPAP